MKCNPSLRHRYEDCPAGYCCVRDEFLPTFVYCRKFGDKDDNCTTKDTESECPCTDGLMCLANIQGKYPSVYGHCVVNATTPATTVTTVTTVDPGTSEPVNMTTVTVANQTSDSANTTVSMDTATTDGNVTMPQGQTSEMPSVNVTTFAVLNSTDGTDNNNSSSNNNNSNSNMAIAT